ncbi:hypothetical protein NSQ62_08320 [Solibacillus sp. FSL H8-0523]|uniref:hypothetical protein n=1 Tax=Solibacillus sp. FSL H8-0523 TaxID=2954511 RepID=UPI003101265F
MIIDYTLENIEDALSDVLCENNIDVILLEDELDHQIWLDGACIRIPELEIDIYSGAYYHFSEEEQEYNADFTIYVFMDLGTRDVIYDEGYTSLGAAVNNFLRGEYNSEKLLSLACEIII